MTVSRGAYGLSRRSFLGGVAAAGGITVTGELRLGSPPSSSAVYVEKDALVEMRDGTKLATDIYRPALGKSGKPRPGQFPTLLSRTPYDKSGYADTARFFARHGYSVVIQDVRGKFRSEGTFYPYRSEGFAESKDGYDTVEWAASQSWSNGHVGTFGSSYLAGTQWALAHNDELPPHLVTMATGYSAASYYGQGAYAGGAHLLSHNLDYTNGFAVERYNREHPESKDDFTFLDSAQEAMPQLFWDLPIVPFTPHKRAGYPWFHDWATHQTYDDYWEKQDHTKHYDKIHIPVLNFGGWYDIFTQGSVWNYQGLRKRAATERAREETHLVMGPYTHGDDDLRAQGQVTGHAYRFPDNSTYDRRQLLLEWFDHHLKADTRGRAAANMPRVRLYVPGLDQWIGANDFPIPETEYTEYYFHSNGRANVSQVSDMRTHYDGSLSREFPDDEPEDGYIYDPHDPVVSVGGYNTHWNGGVADQTTAYHRRDDILVYETPVLKEDMAIVGPITATLYASTSARSTDFIVQLADVDPIDRTGALWVAEGARRGGIGDVEGDPRDLQTYSRVQPLQSGKVYAWKIAVWPTARVFAKGHRLRIAVTSSNFPRYDRNLNTGEGPRSSRIERAEQTIYHHTKQPSSITLPIVEMNRLQRMIISRPLPDSA